MPYRLIFNPQPCIVCGFYECACAIKAKHQAECMLRKMAEMPFGIDCPKHGEENCRVCWGCTCKDPVENEMKIKEKMKTLPLSDFGKLGESIVDHLQYARRQVREQKVNGVRLTYHDAVVVVSRTTKSQRAERYLLRTLVRNYAKK